LLDDLLKFYLNEEVSKQILKKVPYALALSLLVYWLLNFGTTPLGFYSVLIPVISLLSFATSTFIFLSKANGGLADSFGNFDFKSVVGTYSSAYEGQSGLLDEINFRKIGWLVVTALVNGISLIVLLTSAFLLLLTIWAPNPTISLVAVIFLGIFLVQDISSASIVEVAKENDPNKTLAFDFADRFLISNTLAKLPKHLRSRRLFYVASRMIGPLFQMQTPNFAYEAPLVYESPSLVSIVKELTNMEAKTNMFLEYGEGEKIDQFFVFDNRDDRISTLMNKSPREVFPYLFDPNYEDSEKSHKRWISFVVSVRTGNVNRKVGRIFIHRFNVVSFPSQGRIKRRFNVVVPKKRAALQFIMMGDRPFIEYVKKKIELNSIPVAPNDITSD